MRPPGGILTPGEILIATGIHFSSVLFQLILYLICFQCTSSIYFLLYIWLTVFKFIELPENNEKPIVDQKTKVKFKIVSLKVKEGTDYVPELVS